jgi:acyl carrier protein
MPTPPTEEQIEKISRSFRRCREGTVDAIINLRRTGDVSLIPNILRGIVWRYVHENFRPVVEQATAEMPLSSFGIDSLMMLEVVLDTQDALDFEIEDSDLRRMQTIGAAVEFLQQRFVQVHGG